MKASKNSKDKTEDKSLSEFLVESNSKVRSGAIGLFIFILILAATLLLIMFNTYYEEQADKLKSLEENHKLRIDSLVRSGNIEQTLDTAKGIRVYNWRKEQLEEKISITTFSFFKVIGIVALLISPIILIYYYYNFRKIYFHCSNCYKITYLYSIQKLHCPACNKEKSFLKLLNKCTCNTKLKYFKCPHCDHEIDLFKPYNENKIKQKIYGS